MARTTKFFLMVVRRTSGPQNFSLALDALKKLADAKEELSECLCLDFRMSFSIIQIVLVINIFTEALKALQPSTAAYLKSAKYGKVPRSVAIANNVR